MKKLLVAVVLLGLFLIHPGARAQAPQTAQGQAGEAYMDAYVDMLRSDIRGKKIALISQAIPLTDEEAAAFWPLYRKYDADLNRLNDERLALIKDYAASYNARTVTDAKATELATRFFDWEERRVALKRQYFKEFSRALPALKAARLVQLENKVNLLIDVQIAAEVPLME